MHNAEGDSSKPLPIGNINQTNSSQYGAVVVNNDDGGNNSGQQRQQQQHQESHDDTLIEQHPDQYYQKLVDNYDPEEPLSPIMAPTRKAHMWYIVGAIVAIAALVLVVVVTWTTLKDGDSSSLLDCSKSDSDAVHDAVLRWLSNNYRNTNTNSNSDDGDDNTHVMSLFKINICVLSRQTDIDQLLTDANNVTTYHDDNSSSSSASSENGTKHSSSSTFRSVAPDTDAFAVSVDPTAMTITIHGTAGTAAGAGFYWLAKNYFGCQMTWGVNGTGDQTSSFPTTTTATPHPHHHRNSSSFPKNRPALDRVVVKLGPNVRYAWNMCTFGYTSTWWDWARWQRELDWMLLHGINFPLALLGQEYVWMKVYEDLNVTLPELQRWLVGPAFLPWFRAGNVMDWAGPLPREWIVAQYKLQKKILQRMRSFGMKPILPCFSGYVPGNVIKRLWPAAKLQQATMAWGGMPSYMTSCYLMDPVDPQFKILGTMFMRKLREIYGFDKRGYYSCDTFNENNPTSSDSDYLRRAGAAVVNAIDDVDPNGVWVMQGWLFSNRFLFWQIPGRIEAYLSGTPIGRLLLLDLHSEDGVIAFKWKSYYGHAFVWCMLHNYGGRHGMYGNLSAAASAPFEALRHENSTMIGIGFTPEAIEQNPVIYELLTENFFEPSFASSSKSAVLTPEALQYVPAATKHFNVSAWLNRYLGQRYLTILSEKDWQWSTDNKTSTVAPFLASQYAPQVWDAWNLMLHDLYSQWGDPVTEIERQPNIDASLLSLGYGLAGKPGVVLEAATLMMAQASASSSEKETATATALNSGPFMYDLVDMTRQASVMFFGDLHAILLDLAYASPSFNETRFNNTAHDMLSIISTVDELYRSNPNFLFGHWLRSALDAVPEDIVPASRKEAVSKLFWYNGKNQVTLWGPAPSTLDDYAQKPWQGLYKNYYHKRWSAAINAIRTAGGGLNVNQWIWAEQLKQLEVEWCNSSKDLEHANQLYPSSAAPFRTIDQLSSVVHKLLTNISTIPEAEFSENFELVPAASAKKGVKLDYFHQMWTGDVRQLAKLCMYMGPSECVGFSFHSAAEVHGVLFKAFGTDAAPAGIKVYRRK